MRPGREARLRGLRGRAPRSRHHPRPRRAQGSPRPAHLDAEGFQAALDVLQQKDRKKKGAGVVLLGLRGGGRLTSPVGGWKTHHCSARVATDARSPLYLGREGMRCRVRKGSGMQLPSVGFRVNATGRCLGKGCGPLGCSQLARLSAGYSPAPLAVQAPLGPPEIQQKVSGGERRPQRTHSLGFGPPRALPRRAGLRNTPTLGPAAPRRPGDP